MDAVSTHFLNYNECLVYIKTSQPFADVTGATHIARVIRSFIEDDRLLFELQVLTDIDGDFVAIPETIVINGDVIVSNRSWRDMEPRLFYHFSENINYPVSGTRFVIKNNLNQPLESTTRSGLGSGVYGIYLLNESNLSSLVTESNQLVYPIECPDAYIVQDQEHGESITIASLHTNRYLDRIILGVSKETTIDEITSLIHMNSITNLVTLWNIVLYRTQEYISQTWLEDVLASYVFKYIQDASLVDSINGEIIQELPINDIMSNLGYDGLLADDAYNNGWNRGCVSYRYGSIIQGSNARY